MTKTLTLNKAAELLNTTVETVSDCIHRQGLPAAKFGRAFVLVDEDVIAFVRANYGNWKPEKCASTPEEKRASIGLTLNSKKSELDEVLGQLTGPKRRNTPRALRVISGGLSGSGKSPK